MTAAFKHFGSSWPMVPRVGPAQQAAAPRHGDRRLSGAGWFSGAGGSPPFTFVRWKPQATATLNHYAPDFGGSHDLKFGYELLIDSSRVGANANSGTHPLSGRQRQQPAFHVDASCCSTSRRRGGDWLGQPQPHHTAFIQDTWRPTDRLTLNLGVRYEQQRTYFLEAVSSPALADFFPSGTTAGRTNVVWNTWAPRLGVTFAATPRTVLKGHYGRYYINLADAHDVANPASVAWIRYAFLDQNENGAYDGPAELAQSWMSSARRARRSARRGTAVDPELAAEYVDEFSVSLEHEVAADTSLRFSWVRKDLSGDSGIWNAPQQAALLAGRGISCTVDPGWDCPVNALTGGCSTCSACRTTQRGSSTTGSRRFPA